jgi:hypothetical protein
MKLALYAVLASIVLASCTRREPAQLEPGAARQQKDTSGSDATGLDKPVTDNTGTQTQQDESASTDKVENGVVSFTLTNGSKVSVRWDGQADKINSQYGIK